MRGQRHAPAAPYLQEKPGTHCTGGWVGLRSGLDRCGKSRLPPGFDPQTVQPVGSRYTDYPAQFTRIYRSLFSIQIQFLYWKRKCLCSTQNDLEINRNEYTRMFIIHSPIPPIKTANSNACVFTVCNYSLQQLTFCSLKDSPVQLISEAIINTVNQVKIYTYKRN